MHHAFIVFISYAMKYTVSLGEREVSTPQKNDRAAAGLTAEYAEGCRFIYVVLQLLGICVPIGSM